MDRNDFIIAVFPTVRERYDIIEQQYRLRRGGFQPALSDEGVIAIEICGEYFKLECDKDIFAYFRCHYRRFFPKLGDRSLFVRRAASLRLIKAAIRKRPTLISGRMRDPVRVIDTLPLPVCALAGAGRNRCFPAEADFGHCAAGDMHYCGFKSGLRISRPGMITHYPLPPARPHDIRSMDAPPEGFAGIAPADKGFIDEYRQSLLLGRRGIPAVASMRKNMKNRRPKPPLGFRGRVGKIIETVGSRLTGRFISACMIHGIFNTG